MGRALPREHGDAHLARDATMRVPDHQPRFANALSTEPALDVVQQRCAAALNEGLGGRRPDLLVLFATPDYGDDLRRAGVRMAAATGAGLVVGCTGASIVGGGREVESGPAFSAWAASLPGTELRPFRLAAERRENDWVFSDVPTARDRNRTSLLLLGDPHTFPVSRYLACLDEELTGVPVIGGLASGGRGPGENALFLNDGVFHSGAVGVAIEGDVELCSSVSQGCRPVGQPFVITAARQNLVLKIRGGAAASVMLEMLEQLPERDRELFKRGPFVGIAIDPGRRSFDAGDLLVRNIVGMYPQEKGIVIASDSIRAGQTIQFMVRDSDSASYDLRAMLTARAPEWLPEEAAPPSSGALLFTCGGRGRNMFPAPDHDVACVQDVLGHVLPVGGFFANGEIGPVGGRNFLHGFSASVGLFRARA